MWEKSKVEYKQSPVNLTVSQVNINHRERDGEDENEPD